MNITEQIKFNLNMVYNVLLSITDRDKGFWERTESVLQMIITFAPIAAVFEFLDQWFIDNKQFLGIALCAVIVNAGFGVWRHNKGKTFKWKEFWKRNLEMAAIMICVYFMLNLIVVILEENMIASIFAKSIQIMTLLLPMAKFIRSVHFITNGKYPPKWFMDKFYRFEETGDVGELIKKPSEDE